VRLALVAAGLTATIAQLVLMRELVATFYGNELFFGLVLTVWLAWVAAGSWGLGRLALHYRLGRKTFTAGLTLAGALLPAQLTLLRAARSLLRVTPGAFVEFGQMVWIVILVLAPLCLLGGLLFTLGTRLITEQGESTAKAYIWESTGAVAGGALFSFLFIRWFDPYQSALLVTAINLASVVILLSRRRWYSLILLVLLAGAALPLGHSLHEATLRWQWQDLIFAADSPYGRLTIQARDSQRIFFENGLLAFETQGTFPEEVVHFPMLEHPNPQHVLLIGGGAAGDLGEILKHQVSGATYVELDPLLIEAARNYLPPNEAAILNDPRLTLILSDGRWYVKQNAPNRSRFDVIILDLPDPSTGALNRFYTREFFSEVHALLNQGGLFALGLSSAENYWSPELARRNSSIYRTLQDVFPHIIVLPGEHNFFLAAELPLETDPAVLAERLAQRGIETRLVTPEYIKYIFTNDRFVDVRQELEKTASVRFNSDLAPICYYYDLALWLSRFYPNLRGVFESASLVNLWWVTVPLALVLLLVRWRRSWAVPAAIASLGLVQMVLELVILFAFQVLHGYLYAEVSLIITAFMAGLALGGTTSNNLRFSKKTARRALIKVQFAVVIYCGLFSLILTLPIPAPAITFPLLALLAGCLAGAAFPLALILMPGESGQEAGSLYAADLLGGCLGALLGAVLFVPVLGIPQTCVAITLVALGGALALIGQ